MNQNDARLVLNTVLIVVAMVALRLTGTVDWPWWLITAPLWAPIGVVVGSFASVSLFERFKPLKP